MARWLAESAPPHSVSVTHAATLLFEVLRVRGVERGTTRVAFLLQHHAWWHVHTHPTHT